MFKQCLYNVHTMFIQCLYNARTMFPLYSEKYIKTTKQFERKILSFVIGTILSTTVLFSIWISIHIIDRSDRIYNLFNIHL